MVDDSDFLRFLNEPLRDAEVAASSGHEARWRILVVDDDADVHRATQFALDQAVVLGRPLELIFASSAHEAKSILAGEPDIALILLDVVMETSSAGLELVGHIREQSRLKTTRIILRTGQPGYAPEYSTIVNYDINDYRTKSELSQIRLLTAVTAALRSYEQLCSLDANRQGLASIVHASSAFMAQDGIEAFAYRLIEWVAHMTGAGPAGIVYMRNLSQDQMGRVLAATGRFAPSLGALADDIQPLDVRSKLMQALAGAQNVLDSDGIAIYLGNPGALHMAVYLDAPSKLRQIDPQLLEAMCSSFGSCLYNLHLVDKLHTQAYTDALTGLPNRNRFLELIEEADLTGAEPQVLAMVDIDDFASLNDLMGHRYADRLLLAYADRLASTFGKNVHLARVGSNAFGMVGSASQLTPAQLAASYVEHLEVDDVAHFITATSGFVKLTPGLQSGQKWFQDASIALKNAKRWQRGQHLEFTPDLGQLARARAALLSELQGAFQRGELFVVYQPQIALGTSEFVGLEALVRWRKPDGTMIPPDQFIALAEQSGLILPLGDWVLTTACCVMRQLLDTGMAPQRMAVNVSMVQFQRPDFVERVDLALQTSGLSGSRLELEITESVAMVSEQMIAQSLAKLRERNISIAMDDFGTGYSSLSYLERLRFDRLKVDRSFVLQMSGSSAPRITEMILQLGHKLGVRVIAEGIEDQSTLERLLQMGCDEGQGYHIGRPMPLEQLLQWVRAHHP